MPNFSPFSPRRSLVHIGLATGLAIGVALALDSYKHAAQNPSQADSAALAVVHAAERFLDLGVPLAEREAEIGRVNDDQGNPFSIPDIKFLSGSYDLSREIAWTSSSTESPALAVVHAAKRLFDLGVPLAEREAEVGRVNDEQGNPFSTSDIKFLSRGCSVSH